MEKFEHRELEQIAQWTFMYPFPNFNIYKLPSNHMSSICAHMHKHILNKI
jgi:hypothetical protein